MKRPYRFAIVLAGAAIGGFIGMMLTEGWWTWPFLALALLPLLLGVVGQIRTGKEFRRGLPS